MKTTELEDIISSRCFKTNSHKVANACHIVDHEADQLLIMMVYKRGIGPLDSTQEWKITYSAKDVIHDYYKTQDKQEDLINRLEEAPAVQSIQEQINELGYTEQEILNIIKQAIPNKKTCEFASSVLLHGDLETMAKFELDRKQFKRKLKRVVTYAEQHKERFKMVVDAHEKAVVEAELTLLHQYTDIMEKSNNVETDIEELIHSNSDYFEDLIGKCVPYITEQSKMIEHYCLVSKIDMYSLNNYIYKRIAKLERLVA